MSGRNPLLAASVAVGLLFAGLVAQSAAAPASSAAAPLTVAEAMARQDGSTAAVTGYVVGQPVSESSVLRSNFTADAAIAIADSSAETNTTRILYVQVTAAFRTQFGLQSNPSRLGQRIDVTGALTAYFSHPGLKNPSSMALAGAPTPTPTPTPTPGDYYAPAAGKSGASLKASLHQIISVQQTLSYDQVWDALKDTDQDPADSSNVLLLYTGRSQAKGTNGAESMTGTASTSGPSRTATSAPRPAPAPMSTTCGPPTSRSTPPAATRTSTSAEHSPRKPRATTPTPTPGNPAPRSRATSPG